MSGLEIAGVLLGAFPLIISGIENWHNVAKVGGFYWRCRKEFTKCRSDVSYHEILYKRNLKALLLPIVTDADEVDRLVGDPGGKSWTDQALQERLEARLQESYNVYMDIIEEMNGTAEELKKELCFDKVNLQDKLAPRDTKSPQPPPTRPSKVVFSKPTLDFQVFRVKFSLREPVREALFKTLKESNERLEKLLSTSDKMSIPPNASPCDSKRMSSLEYAFKKVWRKSDLLFKAIQKAWNCSCQQYHFANLRLEHRTLPEICFEVILMYVAPSNDQITPWSWRELQCGHMVGCPVEKSQSLPTIQSLPLRAANGHANPTPTTQKAKKVAFSKASLNTPRIEVDALVDPTVHLCHLLGEQGCGNCMGVIGHDNEIYHLHPFHKRKVPGRNSALTLGYVLSQEFEGFLSRRQRYSIALLLGSSVAQLQFTPWLRTGLTKEDVIFFPDDDDDDNAISFSEPFIQQGFSLDARSAPHSDAKECNFFSLGILLLELCFGQRLEDQPSRRRHPAGDGDSKQAFDLMAAIQWSRSIADEGGEDYAAAVKWCFTGAGETNKNWRTEIIKNVIRPLEMCQEHFKSTSTL